MKMGGISGDSIFNSSARRCLCILTPEMSDGLPKESISLLVKPDAMRHYVPAS